jgi:hypothetical protein
MMNGKKIAGKKKSLFAFGNASNGEASVVEQTWEDKIVENKPEDTIKMNQPIFGLFIYFKYYLDLEKYKAIVKFNLDHKAYFKKRDELVNMANIKKYKTYWEACILSFVCV